MHIKSEIMYSYFFFKFDHKHNNLGFAKISEKPLLLHKIP